MGLMVKETIIDHDDITVLNSYVEYNGEKDLKYIIYEMMYKDTTGEQRRAFKAIKLLRIIRLPKNAKQGTRFMDIHAELLAGMWERQVNFITVIANMLKPVPLGLLFCYGIQAVAEDVETAKRLADEDYAALCGSIQGAYRTIEYRELNVDEVEWLRDKMSNMKNLSMLRGLPTPKKFPGEGGTGGFGNMDINPDTQETTEEFIAGLSDKEYVVLLVSTPVQEEVLSDWLTICSRENTKWQAQLQGSQGINFGLSIPMVFVGNLGAAEGWSQGFSDSENVGTSHTDTVGHSFTESFGENYSQSVTHNVGTNQGVSHAEGSNIGVNSGENYGINQSYNEGISHGITHGEGSSYGTSESESYSTSHGTGISENYTTGESHSTTHTDTHSSSQTVTQSTSHTDTRSSTVGQSIAQSQSVNSSRGINIGTSVNKTHSEGINHSESVTGSLNASGGARLLKVGGGVSYGTTNGQSMSDSTSVGYNSGRSYSVGESFGQTSTASRSVSNGYSDSYSRGVSVGVSNGYSDGYSDTVSASRSVGTSENWSESQSKSVGRNYGVNVSDSESITKNAGISSGYSKGISYGQSAGISKSDTVSAGTSESISNGVSYGTSHSISQGKSVSQANGVSWGRSHGVSSGFNGAFNSGVSASMGFGPSIGFNRTFQFIDVEVKNIVEIYEFNVQRLVSALNGKGAFYVDVYIATPDNETQAAATTLAKSAWLNDRAYFCPLQVIDLEGEEKDHMFYHFAAFSTCNTKEGLKGSMLSYKYSTILLADELTAYTHPVRLSEGGQYADVDNIPTLAVPSMMKGEIYMGKVLSAERWTKSTGYKTPFDYRLDGSTALHHAIFTGESRSGKTVAATRFIVEAAIKTRRYGKRLRVVILDPKQDWRVLGKFVEKDRFRFYSLGNPDFLPIKLNLLKIPYGVRPQIYADGVIEAFCRAYQLGEKVKPILRDAIYSAYNDVGCFCKNWKEVAPELSKQVTFPVIYKRIKQKMEDIKASKASFNIVEAYERLLDRLDMFSKDYTVEYQLFGVGGDEGLAIDEILGKDDVIVLESYGLDPTFKSFVFGQITAGIWQYCYGHPGGFKAEDQYSTVLVIEEANEVLIGQSADGNSTMQGTSMFEKIVDQAAGLELFIIAITQKIADMPQSIIANAGLLFTFKISRAEDKDVVMEKIGRDSKFDDRPLRKFFPKMPTGWAVCKSGRTFDYKEAEAVLVAVDKLDVEPPTDEELLNLMALRSVKL